MISLEGKRILVVEDNQTINRQLSAIIRKHGAEVFSASNGQEGCDLALKELPDLILMDVQMPKMDGCDASRSLKSTEDTNHIPIIMLTGNKNREDIDKGLNCGASDYLTKPAAAATIIETIKKHL